MIFRMFSQNVGIKLYVDDVKLYIAHKNDSERNELSKALSKLEILTKTNGLKYLLTNVLLYTSVKII